MVFAVVFDDIPNRCPYRERQIEPRLVDIFDVGRHMKLLGFKTPQLHRIINLQIRLLRESILKAEKYKDKKSGKINPLCLSHNLFLKNFGYFTSETEKLF